MVWGSIFQHPFSNPDRLCPEPVPVSGHCAQWQIACSALASSQTGYRVKGLPYQRIAQHLHHSRVMARPWIWFACLDHTHLSVHLLFVVATFFFSWRHAGSPGGPGVWEIYPLHEGQATAANMATVATTGIRPIGAQPRCASLWFVHRSTISLLPSTALVFVSQTAATT